MVKTSPADASDSVILKTAQRMHRLALQRGYYFYTNLFKNPTWLIMLNLFVNERTDILTNFTSLTITNRLTKDELHAAIEQLLDAGMIMVEDDEQVVLTPLASKQVAGFIREILKSRENEG
jgi:delta-aminolevulinic acid dehydratase/porphobilinogen synthase